MFFKYLNCSLFIIQLTYKINQFIAQAYIKNIVNIFYINTNKQR